MRKIIVDTTSLPTKNINNVMYKFVFDENTGAKYLIMRIAEVPPGERVPRHTHTDEEQAYLILEGEGVVVIGDKSYRVRKGYAVLSYSLSEREKERSLIDPSSIAKFRGMLGEYVKWRWII